VPRIPAASAEALLERMHANIDRMCAERDRIRKEQGGSPKGKVLVAGVGSDGRNDALPAQHASTDR